MTTQTLPQAWQKAIARAEAEQLQALPLADGSYAVPSTKYALGSFHIVRLEAGKIVECTNCPGWENGGRQRPCKHVGCVARLILSELHEARDLGVIVSQTTKSQVYQSEAGA